ncbi:hypothetical protein TNCV_1324371 [Trichonephila clavipes]|nr:hypothetical protein TNCV_1324371 [Trichonephila clavipes]
MSLIPHEELGHTYFISKQKDSSILRHTYVELREELILALAGGLKAVARWVKIFNEAQINVAYMHRSCPSVTERKVRAVAAVLDSDRRQTIRETA